MERREIAAYDQAVEYLLDIPRFTGKHSLEETRAHLGRLGYPDRGLNIIHVAGTNGKGSVCAYLRSILEEAGYSVCAFTSPHLTDIRERFLVRGHMVDRETFLRAFLAVYDSLDWEALTGGEGYHPTFFEYLFFMAMFIFKEAGGDYCILETGLGGRLDATNAVEKKKLAVITRIGLDHMEYLGDTMEKIAEEKAGIMRPGVALVYADTREASSGVFRKKGEEIGAKLYALSKKDYIFSEFKNKNIDFSLHTEYYGYISLNLRTIARYQMENASLAVRAIEVLDGGRTVSACHIKRGLANCFWQGRMEEVRPEVYVDGAHNEDGIRAFLETVRGDGVTGGRTLLFSAVRDKEYVKMARMLALSGLFEDIAIAPLKSGRRAEAERLAEAFEHCPRCAYCLYGSSAEAFRSLLAGQKGRVYIVGSLYLVGEIKEFLENDQF